MLSFSKKEAEKVSPDYKLILEDKSTGKKVFAIPDSELPHQKHDNPMSLINPERMMKLKKRYGVSNKVLNMVAKSYQQRNERTSGLPDEVLDWRVDLNLNTS